MIVNRGINVYSVSQLMEKLHELADADIDEMWPCTVSIENIRCDVYGSRKQWRTRQYLALQVNAIKVGGVVLHFDRDNVDAHITLGTWLVNNNQRPDWDNRLRQLRRQVQGKAAPYVTRPCWLAAKMRRNLKIDDPRQGEAIMVFNVQCPFCAIQ